MKYLHKILLILAVTVLSAGCIKEDMADCDNVTIYFQYLADGEEDVLYQYMSKVDLYVFDENGHIMGVGNYNQDELKNFAAIPSFKLTPGKRYKVVALGNAYDHTQVVNVEATSFSDIFLQSPEWDDPSAPVTNHDNNYLGMLEFVMPDNGVIMYRDTVTLYSAHIDVELEIHGLPAPASVRQADNIHYQLSFENSNAQTSFENKVNVNEKGTIYPDLIYDYERNCYRTDDLALFRMDHDGILDKTTCNHTLVLMEKETGKELIRGNILDYLKEHQDDIDLTKQEAMLPIAITFNGVTGVIDIPDWAIVDTDPGWN